MSRVEDILNWFDNRLSSKQSERYTSSELQKIKRKVALFKDEIDEIRSSLNPEIEEKYEIKYINTKLSNKADVLNKKIGKLEKENTVLRKNNEKLKVVKRSTIKKTTAENNKVLTANRELEKINKLVKEQKLKEGNLRNTNKNLVERVAKLVKQTETLSNQLDSINKELVDLKYSYKVLENSNQEDFKKMLDLDKGL